MEQASKRQSWKFTVVAFGLVPAVLGLGAARYLNWTDVVWLSSAGAFWPIVLSGASVAILIKLMLSPFAERTSGVAAWLTLAITWFYFPAWAMAIAVPQSAAVVGRSGRVHIASEVARYPEQKVWLLTDRAGVRIVYNVVGQIVVERLGLEYRHAEPYIATRRHDEDLAGPLASAANAIVREAAARPRGSRIALLEQRAAQDALLASICRAAVGAEVACPLKMRLAPLSEATLPGETWSSHYTEQEAIAERHLPTMVNLLTQPDSPLVDRDRVFALLLQLAETAAPLAQVAQKPQWLDDRQYDELIRRIMELPDCGNEAIAILATAVRLQPEQRQALRAKVLAEANVARLVEHAQPLRLSDPEIAVLAPRMRAAFTADPALALRTLEVFGERLPAEAQQDAVRAIVRAKASHALTALRHVGFAPGLRQELMQKVLADADHDVLSSARLSKDWLQGTLTPAEMRALTAMAVKRGETSQKWLDFALKSLPVRGMTPGERKSVLNGLLFDSPRAALEFVSENRRYLDPAEVDEVTRDYTRSIAPDLCLHLSHRNKNRRFEYFSESQLQILRECAQGK